MMANIAVTGRAVPVQADLPGLRVKVWQEIGQRLKDAE